MPRFFGGAGDAVAGGEYCDGGSGIGSNWTSRISIDASVVSYVKILRVKCTHKAGTVQIRFGSYTDDFTDTYFRVTEDDVVKVAEWSPTANAREDQSKSYVTTAGEHEIALEAKNDDVSTLVHVELDSSGNIMIQLPA